MVRIVSYADCRSSDLVIDAVYEGKPGGHLSYEEVREDRQPIIFFSGRDIVDVLMKSGYNTPNIVAELLNNEFAVSGERP